MTELVFPYHLQYFGLPNIYVTNGVRCIEQPNGREDFEYSRFSELIQVALMTVCLFDGDLNQVAITSLTNHLDISSAEMSKILDVDVAHFRRMGTYVKLPKDKERVLKSMVVAYIDPDYKLSEFLKSVKRKAPEKFIFSIIEGIWKHDENYLCTASQ